MSLNRGPHSRPGGSTANRWAKHRMIYVRSIMFELETNHSNQTEIKESKTANNFSLSRLISNLLLSFSIVLFGYINYLSSSFHHSIGYALRTITNNVNKISIEEYYDYFLLIPIIMFIIGLIVRHITKIDNKERIKESNNDILWVIIPIFIIIISSLFAPLGR